MKTTKSQEQLIRQALRQAFAEEQAELMKNDDSPPLSPDFEARLQARINQPAHPRRRLSRTMRLVIAAVLILLLLFFCTGMAPVVKRIIRLIKKEDVQHTNTEYTYVVEGQERKAFDISAYYTLREVPEGFHLIYSEENPLLVHRLWQKGTSETCIVLMQVPFNRLFTLSTNGFTEKTITLHGREATLYTKPNAENLVWRTDDCMFVLGYWGPDAQGIDIFALESAVALDCS